MIIGFAGYAGSGKTLAASILEQSYGFKRTSFADPVREALEILDPIVAGPNTHLTDLLVEYGGWQDIKTAPEYPEVRRLLQRLGTDIGRNLIAPDVWINMWDEQMDQTPSWQNIVVDDVRFPEEADAIRVGRPGVVLRLIRPDTDAQVGPHFSENPGALHVDAEIHNTGSVFELEDKLEEIMSGL